MNLQDVEAALVTALKSRDQIAADTLRALKTRIQNEQIAKGANLDEAAMLALVQSEVKRRKEAAESFRGGNREEAAQKEEAEAHILMAFLPPQLDESEILTVIEDTIAREGWGAKDFGQAMGALKVHFGTSAEGGVIAKLLKEKLK